MLDLRVNCCCAGKRKSVSILTTIWHFLSQNKYRVKLMLDNCNGQIARAIIRDRDGQTRSDMAAARHHFQLLNTIQSNFHCQLQQQQQQLLLLLPLLLLLLLHLQANNNNNIRCRANWKKAYPDGQTGRGASGSSSLFCFRVESYRPVLPNRALTRRHLPAELASLLLLLLSRGRCSH